jgi:hypothetical protein
VFADRGRLKQRTVGILRTGLLKIRTCQCGKYKKSNDDIWNRFHFRALPGPRPPCWGRSAPPPDQRRAGGCCAGPAGTPAGWTGSLRTPVKEIVLRESFKKRRKLSLNYWHETAVTNPKMHKIKRRVKNMLTWNKNGLWDNLTSQVYEHSAFTNRVFMNLNEKKTQEVSSFLSIDWPQSTQYEQENVNIIGIILRGRILQIC